MKEFLLTGVAVTFMALLNIPVDGPVPEPATVHVEPARTGGFEGFVPHERVTELPVREQRAASELLPDYGSPAYL